VNGQVQRFDSHSYMMSHLPGRVLRAEQAAVYIGGFE
jgi:hypothetical protein